MESRETTHTGSDTSSDDETVHERYIEAFGHKYHPSGKIFLPFDKPEQQRMETQHRLYRLCLDGSLTATRLPLDVANILDLGTGTGVWAIEMAARYPQARIVGIDASPIQRKKAVPPNVTFEIGDVENPWPIPSGSLDFVHSRSIAGGVRDWVALFNQALEKLKPGGILEMTEIAIQFLDFDGKFGEAELCPGILATFRSLSEKVGIDFHPSPRAPDRLLETGFEKIVQRTEILPLGNWAADDKLKARQTLMNEIATKHFDNHCALLFQSGGYKKEDLDALIPTFWKDIEENSPRPYMTAVFTTARKPQE
ncbi:S-adenosyl-L-methionine-dependent methyltransferase [Xylariaceae sp. FL0662B]|nr:S-adenosyl-L-methionine-dependent methyltransferase [Xylariaceae sp. FL0662B]